MSEASDRSAKKGVWWTIVIGTVIGAAHGIRWYGTFSVGNAAMIGLGVIVACGVFAIIVACRKGDTEGQAPQA